MTDRPWYETRIEYLENELERAWGTIYKLRKERAAVEVESEQSNGMLKMFQKMTAYYCKRVEELSEKTK